MQVRHTAAQREMPQVLPVEQSAELLEKLDLPPSRCEAKVDIFFFVLSLPQFGQVT